MGEYRSGSEAMRAYALARVTAADQVLAAHRGDSTGCCVACGRTMPCADADEAIRLRAHYRDWLAATAPPPSPALPTGAPQPQLAAGEAPEPARLRLIRPYVFRRGR